MKGFTKIGNSLFSTDPQQESFTKVGNTWFGTKGSSYTKVGNTYFKNKIWDEN